MSNKNKIPAYSYIIEEEVKVPLDTNIYFSIEVTRSDANAELAGYTIANIVPPGDNIYIGYDDKTEVKDKKIGRGKDIIDKKLSTVTSLTRFSDTDITYKIIIEAGDKLLLEKEITETKYNSFCIYSIIKFTQD